MARSLAHEDHLFQQRVIALRSANEVHVWFFALWFAALIGLGTVAVVALYLPTVIARVNAANAEDVH
jgi:hypothetical protein